MRRFDVRPCAFWGAGLGVNEYDMLDG